MEMIDLGKGVRVCATDRSYFKCLVEGKKDQLGNPVYVTLRVAGGKIPFTDGVSEMQRTVIRANMTSGPVLKTAEERAIEEAGSGQKAALYRDLVEKDIVTFFDENQGSEEKVLLTAGQLAELVESKSGTDDDLLGEIAELREQLEEMKNMNAELNGRLADAQNIKGVKHEQGSVDANTGRNAAGSVGQVGAEGDGDAAEAGPVRAGRGRKANKAATGGDEGSEGR